jgi:beta-lactamase class A
MKIVLRQALPAALFICGIGAGFLAQKFFSAPPIERPPCASDYEYINPEPDCETYESSVRRLDALQGRLDEVVANITKRSGVRRAAVFSRDLTTRRFVAVNENDVFDMASLLKVPLAVAYFKVAEANPEILEKEVKYTGEPNLYASQNIPVKERLTSGETYTVRELIRRTLVYSDNTAAQILVTFIKPEFLDDILVALNLLYLREPDEGLRFMTAKSYANIFRSLYNASYLTREYSNQLLEMLAGTAFGDGATAKLPDGLRVFHKFGERLLYNRGGRGGATRQLHDCGIVYSRDGEKPYTFCILMEGDSFKELQDVIQELSSAIYEGMMASENVGAL